MSLKLNNTTITGASFNGVTLCKLIYNGTLAWESHAYGSWTTTTAATCTLNGTRERKCSRTNCGAVQSGIIPALGHISVNYPTVAATCTATGLTGGTYCSTCNAVLSNRTTTSALGHSWKTPEYQWSGFTSCEATRRCNRDTSHKERSTTTNITSAVTTQPTCTATGVRTYTATFPSTASWAGTSTTTEILSKIDHTYTVTYSWNGYTACTATRKCSSCGHSESVSAARITNDGVNATCTQPAVRTYTATFSKSWAGTSQKTQAIAALGHLYGTASYSWTGYTACKATRTCGRCNTPETASATITNKVTTNATCTTSGVRTYTATFPSSISWASTQTKTESIAATGHNYSSAISYTWALDYSTCVASRTCTNDISHKATLNGVVNSSVTKQPTTTTTGIRTYTAIFTAGGNFSNVQNQTKQVTIPMLDPETDTYELLLPSAVTLKGYEYTDMDASDYEDGRGSDELVAGGYLKNNSNVVVPALYKNDVESYDEPDMGDAFFYVGQGTFNGVTCDKWRKIGNPAAGDCDSQYTWTSSGQQYIYTNVIVSNNRFINGIFGKVESGTASISWRVTSQKDSLGMNVYSFMPTAATVQAPSGYTITEVTNLTLANKGVASGTAPRTMTPTSIISSDGKTVMINLSSSGLLKGTGNGTATVNYSIMCKK
jgi:hypothetical protein